MWWAVCLFQGSGSCRQPGIYKRTAAPTGVGSFRGRMAEWSKALVLGTSLFGGASSNLAPFTFFVLSLSLSLRARVYIRTPAAEVHVRADGGTSSIGRVRALQARGTGIETRVLHPLYWPQRQRTTGFMV